MENLLFLGVPILKHKRILSNPGNTKLIPRFSGLSDETCDEVYVLNRGPVFV